MIIEMIEDVQILKKLINCIQDAELQNSFILVLNDLQVKLADVI